MVQTYATEYEIMSPAFTTLGDGMPRSTYTAWKYRFKLSHQVGVHGRVKWVSNHEHPYTGVFKGSELGIVRFSSAAEPVVNNSYYPLNPNMALKFLRGSDNKVSKEHCWDSANMLAAHSMDG